MMMMMMMKYHNIIVLYSNYVLLNFSVQSHCHVRFPSLEKCTEQNIILQMYKSCLISTVITRGLGI
jgi:hypothetical protein